MNSIIIEELFSCISREDVVLFVGAGVSMSAGLPSGAKLSEVIFNKLSPEMQESLMNNKWDLAQTSQTYINVYGADSRNKLINEIKIQFDYAANVDITQTPINHISKAPHFSTIISTNYDFLIEQCLGDNCVVINNDSDIPKVGAVKDKTILVKLHGDFNNPNRIILTKDDYNDLYLPNAMETPIWRYTKNLITTKTTLFLGYGYNDGNIDSILSYIDSSTKNNRKSAYLITKAIAPHKKAELKSKKIKFIELDLDNFFYLYFERFNSSIISDFNAGITAYETMNRYVNHAVVAHVKNGQVVSAQPKDDSVLQTVTFSTDNRDVYAKIFDRDNFEDIIITDVQSFCRKIGNITIPIDEIAQIAISRNPDSQFYSSIYFFDTDLYIENIPTSIFKGETKVKISCFMPECNITINLQLEEDKNNATFDIKLDTDISIENELQAYKLLDNLFQGGNFRVTTSDGIEFFRNSFTQTLPIKSDDSLRMKIQHLQFLLKIQRYYNVKFSQHTSLSASELHKAEVIAKNIDGDILDFESNIKSDRIAIKTYLTPRSKDDASSLVIHNEHSFSFIDTKFVDVELYGQRIELGYRKFEVKDPISTERKMLANGEEELIMVANRDNCRLWFQEQSPNQYLEANN